MANELRSARHAYRCSRVARDSLTAFVECLRSYAKAARQNEGNMTAKRCGSVLRLAADAPLHAARSHKQAKFAGLPHSHRSRLSDRAVPVEVNVLSRRSVSGDEVR